MKFVWKDDPWKPNSMGDYFIYDNLKQEKVYDKIALTEINGEILPFYLNRFAERYMSPGTIDFTTGVTLHPTMWCNLSIKPSDYQEAKREVYVNGYDGEFQNVLSNPVNGKLDPRMKFLWTYASEITPPPPTVPFEMSFSGSTEISYQSGSTTISFSANTEPVVYSASSWINNVVISADTYDDIVAGTVSFNYGSNPEESARTGFIEFVADNQEYSGVQSLHISQSSGETHYENEYLTLEIVSGGTIVYSKSDGTTSSLTIMCSINNGEWQTMYNQDYVTVSAGDTVRLKGTNDTYGSSDGKNYRLSGSTAYYKLYGNILSLIYGDNFANYDALSYKYTFFTFFGSTNVINADNLVLPATAVEGSYSNMFTDCSSLTSAAFVVSSNLGYQSCSGMFYHCTGLLNPPVLPATALASSCYRGMFTGCVSLATAPQLPAITLAASCYQSMFNGCTSLTSAPELNADVLVIDCYNGMFFNCSSLEYVKCMATDLGNYSGYGTTYWLRGVAAIGTFVKSYYANWNTGDSGIPDGWTVIEE